MSAELEARIRRLEKEVERLSTAPRPSTNFASAAASVPPTDAELEVIFANNLYVGFIGYFQDFAFPVPNKYLVVRHGTGAWAYVVLT